MKDVIHTLFGAILSAFVLAGIVALPAAAQDKATDAKAAEKGRAVQKVLHDDDKVRLTETTFQPGDVGGNVVRGFRVVRYL